MKNSKIFWLNGFEGLSKGGLYFRSYLNKHISKIEKELKAKVVGIVIEDSWNIEFLIESPEQPTHKKTRVGSLEFSKSGEQSWVQEA